MRRLVIAAARRARQEGGFTIAGVLMAVLVLAIAADTRSLGYTQLTADGLASALQPIVPGSTVSGTSLQVQRTLSTSSGTQSTFNATFTACSLDDPADGAGSHSAAPISGG